MTGQLELAPTPRCPTCGPLGWTVEKYGRSLHKCACPHRTDAVCQAHPQGCDDFTDIRVKTQECVCAEINIRHCPIHGQGDTDQPPQDPGWRHAGRKYRSMKR